MVNEFKHQWNPFRNDDGLVCSIDPTDGIPSFDIFDADSYAGDNKEGKELAAEITKRWNCHDHLVKALKEMVDWWEKDGGSMDDAIAAAKIVLSKAI